MFIELVENPGGWSLTHYFGDDFCFCCVFQKSCQPKLTYQKQFKPTYLFAIHLAISSCWNISIHWSRMHMLVVSFVQLTSIFESSLDVRL